MPPIDTPLDEQLDDLNALAEAGDPVAACRLALEGKTCRARQKSAEFRRRMEQSLIAGSGVAREELLIDALAAADADGASAEHYCEGVALERLPSLEASLRRALHNLTPRQKVLIALARQDGTLRRIPHALPEGVTRSGFTDQVFPQILADNLIEFLHAGLAAADPLALEGLILLHAPRLLQAPEHGMHLPDPIKFSIYASLMARLFGPAALGPQVEHLLGASMATLTPEEHGRLVRMLDQEEQRWLTVSTADRGLGLPSATDRTARHCED